MALIVAVAIAASGGSGTGHHQTAASDAAGATNGSATGRGRATAVGVASQAGLPGAAAQAAAVQRLAALGLPIYCAGPRGHYVALTFDDGPGLYTGKAIRKLTAHHARATFFLVGKEIVAYPHLARGERRVAAVGDHTMTHPFLPGLSQSAMSFELANAKRLIERNARQPVMLFRPPYGARTPSIDAEARSLGLLQVIWSVDSRDSEGASYAQIASSVVGGARPGAIILMHENRGQTIRALFTIFPGLARKHLRAVTLPELLALDPPSAQQVHAGPGGCGTAGASSAGTHAAG